MTLSSRLQPAVAAMQAAHRELRATRALLVAISGIDGAGKGFVTARLAEKLQTDGLAVAVLHVDGWLNLPHIRFSAADPAAHFYANAVRFEEMFSQLVEPLRRDRSIQLEANFTEERASEYRRQTYVFRGIDVILLEGIFLLKETQRHRFDLALWIQTSFETALRRAIARGQEGLSPTDTAAAFRRIYFPAQRLHLACDQPAGNADFIIANETSSLLDSYA